MFDRLPSTTDELILDELSPASLIIYSQLCKTTRNNVEQYQKQKFNINHLLSRFFRLQEIPPFRYIQSKTQMFISGSTVLQFFDRTFYPDSDLDLYVEHRYRETIVAWLMSVDYVFKPRKHFSSLAEQLAFSWDDDSVVSPSHPFFESQSNGYFGRGVANVYDFFKSNRKIQLITSNHTPLEIVLNYHSTCVMNIITHEKAYSLFPRASFEERRSLMISTEGAKQDTARAKYVSRGWTMVERLTEAELKDKSAFLSAKRYVGDTQCWTISLYPRLDCLPEAFMETNTWALKYNLEGVPRVEFKVLLTNCLNFSYLVVDDAMARYLWPYICPTEIPKRDIDKDLLQLVRWQRM